MNHFALGVDTASYLGRLLHLVLFLHQVVTLASGEERHYKMTMLLRLN